MYWSGSTCKQLHCIDGDEHPCLGAESFAAGVGRVRVVLTGSRAHTQTQQNEADPVEHVLSGNAENVLQTETVQLIHLQTHTSPNQLVSIITNLPTPNPLDKFSKLSMKSKLSKH